jgi:hypothetical protein
MLLIPDGSGFFTQNNIPYMKRYMSNSWFCRDRQVEIVSKLATATQNNAQNLLMAFLYQFISSSHPSRTELESSNT